MKLSTCTCHSYHAARPKLSSLKLSFSLPKKGFPPLCIQGNQPNHTEIGAGAEAVQSCPKKRQRKSKRNKCRQRRINKTKKPRDCCVHRDLPLGSKTPKRRHLSTPPRRIATMTTLLPRVSLGTRRGERKGSPRRPPGRPRGTHRRHRAGVGHADRGFPRSQPAPRALRIQPPNQPPPCANAVMTPPRRLTTALRSEDGAAKNLSRD